MTEARAENFAVIHPFSGSARKNWPLENFGQLARRLEIAMPVYWCYGPNDPPVDDAVRIENLYELACWLAKASLFVGNDSGITHLAARWARRCWRCSGRTRSGSLGGRGGPGRANRKVLAAFPMLCRQR